MNLNLFKTLSAHRQLIIELIKIELLSEFKRSFLGVFWVFFKSLFPLVLWLLLQQAGLFKPGSTKIHYALYLLVGLSIWNLFHQIYEKVSEALVQYATILKEARFSHEVLLYTKALTAIIMQGLPLIISLVLLIFMAKVDVLSIFLGLILLLPVMIAALSTGIILSVVRVVLPDVFQVIDRVFSLGLYVTPLVYTESVQSGWLKFIIQYNPLTYLIGLPRNLMTGAENSLMAIQIFIALSIFSCVFWYFATMVFRKSEKRFVELLVF